MMQIFRLKDSVTGRNCHQVAPHNLVMGGDVTYGVKTQFESEARTALRLSHFLCNFLQVSHWVKPISKGKICYFLDGEHNI